MKKKVKVRCPKFEAKVHLMTQAAMNAAGADAPRLACVLMFADDDGHLAMVSNVTDESAKTIAQQCLAADDLSRGALH